MIKRLIGWFILAPISIILIIFALANRQLIVVNFDPFSVNDPLIPAITIPLFLLIFILLLIGIFLGGISVWFSQAKIRWQLRKARINIKALQLEIDELKSKKNKQNAQNQSILDPTDII